MPTGERAAFCKYHQSDTHWTEDCSMLKNRVASLAGSRELEQMLAEYLKPMRREGRQREPRRSRSPKRQKPKREREKEQRHNTPQPHDRDQAPFGEIRTIARGFTGGGATVSSKKAHARKARYHETMWFGHSIGVFQVMFPHDDALVVTLLIGNYTTRQVLVDNGSSINILFWDTFIRIGINPDRLCPSPSPLNGFSGKAFQPMGAIALPVVVVQGAHIVTTMTDFLVVKAPSSYNAILGRPTLNDLKIVTPIYHLKMKFQTETGIDEVRGEQLLARKCYVQELKAEGA
ncbi:uncharacterized protein LOC118343795 [Juglans regia]|uniref:Uncharacterized protein LOC118343795 n=1 Tax=Juglans regia TaxID=51240 RepID=A0A6P9E2G6_JUGRE|nr:uncharacterized protein LOC118343795 [Juglans regia]